MYTVAARAHYDAAHALRNYEGKCNRLHGHRYVVEVALQTESLDDAGMVYDFGDLKKDLEELADRLDHRNLNEVPPFTEIESTAENQARFFFDEMAERLPPSRASGLLYARVWESPGQWAQYGPAPVGLPEGPDPEG
jgi:6-pyruvoyltetrahydropterin/6-carboxytetrahydropterin synthase